MMCMFSPGEEEETEDIRDDEHVEDQTPFSTSCKGPSQKWTNGCSNAEILRSMTNVTRVTPPKVERLCS